MVSKHLDRKKSYASEAVRTRGALYTVNRFFKVAASVWKHPELSEQCEVWGLSAEKSTFPRGQTIQKPFYFKCVYVCGCVRARVLKIRFLTWNWLRNNLSKGTSNKREDCKRFTGWAKGGGGINIPYINTHNSPSFSPDLFRTVGWSFWQVSPPSPPFTGEPICFLNSKMTVKSTASWGLNAKNSASQPQSNYNPGNNSNI